MANMNPKKLPHLFSQHMQHMYLCCCSNLLAGEVLFVGGGVDSLPVSANNSRREEEVKEKEKRS